MSLENTTSIDNWRRCDINQLAHHFHIYNQDSRQFERVGVFDLTPPKGTIIPKRNDGLEIRMSLTSPDSKPETVTFQPLIVLRVPVGDKPEEESEEPNILSNGKPLYSTSNVGAAKVPKQYLETVSSNWQALDQAKIDDAFLAMIPLGLGGNAVLQRLSGYIINSEYNKSLYDFLMAHNQPGQLKKLKLHLGVDFNKRPDNEEFQFAPVVEVRVKTGEAKLKDFEGTTIVDINDDEATVYFQYMRPCPPFCNSTG